MILRASIDGQKNKWKKSSKKSWRTLKTKNKTIWWSAVPSRTVNHASLSSAVLAVSDFYRGFAFFHTTCSVHRDIFSLDLPLLLFPLNSPVIIIKLQQTQNSLDMVWEDRNVSAWKSLQISRKRGKKRWRERSIRMALLRNYRKTKKASDLNRKLKTSSNTEACLAMGQHLIYWMNKYSVLIHALHQT